MDRLEQELRIERCFLRQTELQGPAPHHPRQAATGQGRCQPGASRAHQEVGRGATAELTAGAQQQGLLGSGAAGLSPGLDRLAIGKGFALAQLAGALAPFQLADPGRHGAKAGLERRELQPEAVQQGRLARCGQINAPAWGRPPTPVQAQGTASSLRTLQSRRDKGLDQLFAGWLLHTKNGGRAAPALEMGVQQPGLTLLHQHRFKQAIGQGEAAIIEGQAQLVGPAPQAPLRRLAGIPNPGDRLGLGLACFWPLGGSGPGT